MKHVDSWKNKSVFEDQLALNEKELFNYPPHWNYFLNATHRAAGEHSSILDIGCGAGVYHELCKKHFPNIKYMGMDYSEEAVEIAKQKWGGDCWKVGSYTEVTAADAASFDILHAGALLDVLPNGDEALEFLLTLGFKNIILGRVKLTDQESHFSVYEAYNKIQTYAYYHNKGNLIDMIRDAKYVIELIQGEENSCTILLRKSQ